MIQGRFFDEKTVKWAQRINNEYKRVVDLERKSVRAIISLGTLLIEAKAALDHGDWGRMFQRHPAAMRDSAPFSQDKTECLMAIARHPALSNPENSRNLPVAWSTLHALSRVPAKALQAAIASDRVHAQMTLSEAKQIGRDHAVHPVASPRATSAADALDTAREALRKLVDDYLALCPGGKEQDIEGCSVNFPRNVSVCERAARPSQAPGRSICATTTRN